MYLPVTCDTFYLIGVSPEQTWACVTACPRARAKTHRIVSRFHVSAGRDRAPNLCPGELTLFSPPELCLGAGHLAGATGERQPQPSPNPEESIDASMAAGLSSAQAPQGGLLISINVKWCCPQANMKATHTHTYTRVLLDVHAHTHTCEPELIYIRRCDGGLVVLGAKYEGVIRWCS